MIAAEKWHEHQTNYQKYGIDMRPKSREVKQKRPDLPAERQAMMGRDKSRLILLTIFAGFLGIFLIITAAYSAQIQYNVNELLAVANITQGEIENLNVAIKSATNITIIEERALNELGMVYPSASRVAYVRPALQADQDFALALKQIAYNE